MQYSPKINGDDSVLIRTDVKNELKEEGCVLDISQKEKDDNNQREALQYPDNRPHIQQRKNWVPTLDIVLIYLLL
jgi:hypothetical protein